ncbi:fimbrial protein [Acinetobacter sp. NIPH 2377]|jgi:major type 1 subunit fimbrin (pilin)|uniref:fimbrial protein n=1 Tax=Acinetobacter terrestris TaxID=2529843 RepID=UPI00148F9EBD|nr:fimbrial protein [Acinetobacter terrestris]NNH35970.1 fimbrial protein [Acinetobacter terrestris]
MKTQIALLLGTITALTMTTHALAAGQINFTGEIVSAACDVKINNGSNNEIALGKWPTSMFKAAGDKSTPQTFSIDVTNCAAGNYQVNFSGATDTANAKLLKTSAATGVGIAIANASNTSNLVSLNTTAGTSDSNAVFTATGTSGSLPLQAFYQATGATVAAGKADATVSITLQVK